jgi:uncharacterized protein YjbJ (UPF0337 family)
LNPVDRLIDQRVSGLLGWKLSGRQQQQQAHPHTTRNMPTVVQDPCGAVKSDTADVSRFEGQTGGGSGMNKDEFNGKVDRLKGKIKEEVAHVTNDEELRDEGLADQAAGNVEEGFGKARRKVGDALHEVAHKIKD